MLCETKVLECFRIDGLYPFVLIIFQKVNEGILGTWLRSHGIKRFCLFFPKQKRESERWDDLDLME